MSAPATLAEPGLELDALVAEKVMGWTDISLDARTVANNSTWFVPHGREFEGGDYYQLLSYSTDIAAAWEVVEHMKAHPDPKRRNLRLVAWCYSRTYAVFGASDDAEPWSEANGEYATPHAICLAALRAIDAS